MTNKFDVTTDDAQALTNKDLTGAGNTFPTFNQNTTGTAAGITGKTTPSGALVGTTDTQALTHKDLTDASNTFPTLNQNTTGSAAKLTTARNINGVAFDGSAAVTLPPMEAFCPADYSWIAWSGDPLNAYTNAAFSVAGDAFFTLIPIRAATTITNVIMYVAVAGATLTSGQNFAGLFNSSGTLLSATADQSTNWQSTGLKTMALSSSQAVAAGMYYVGFFQNGTTLPKFTYNAAVNALTGGNSGPNPRYGIDVTHTGRTTTFPSPATITANQANGPWVAVS